MLCEDLICSLAEHIHLFVFELFPIAALKGFAYICHKVIIEIEVMDYAEAHGEELARFEEVADIGTGIGPADGAVTMLVERAGVKGIFVVIEV